MKLQSKRFYSHIYIKVVKKGITTLFIDIVKKEKRTIADRDHWFEFFHKIEYENLSYPYRQAIKQNIDNESQVVLCFYCPSMGYKTPLERIIYNG